MAVDEHHGGDFAFGEWTLPGALAAVLFVTGLLSVIGPAWGYGLLLLATLLLAAGCILFAIFILTKAFDSTALRRAFGSAFWFGAWCYVFAVAALSGYFIREALEGRLEFKWIVFGPVALVTIIFLDWGLYRILVGKNFATWQRYSQVITRDRLDPAAMRATLIDEVILHKSLFTISPFRWARHQLIFWGFGLMLGVELVAVFFREAFPAFGLRDVWHEHDHPLRLMFDFAYDITGAMVLAGCVMALIYRARVNGKPDQKYTDTPTVIFLLIVIVTGFVVEGLRIAGSPGADFHAASPVGLLFAQPLYPLAPLSSSANDAIWLFHVLLSCAFIAYVPAKRLIHSCATPMGRLMNSQKAMLAAKKEYVLKGLMGGGRGGKL